MHQTNPKQRIITDKMTGTKKMAMSCIVVIVVASLTMASMGTFEEDEKECADQLANLASCIPFVSGTASKPTTQCCQDTQKVKTNKPKCLCVLIKESTDPSMGLPVNTTLALQMPSICKIDASVSNCPTLLNLSPDSPDAKIFKDSAGSDSSTSSTANSPPTSASSGASSSPSSSSSGSSSQADSKSNAGAKMKLVGRPNFLVMLASVAWIFI